MTTFKMIARRVMVLTLGAVILLSALLMLLKDKIMLGAEAYLYGYPLVMMETTRVHSGQYIGPENQLRLVRQFPDASFKDVVRPNVDTLYTTAFINMKEGPWVFEMPANAERYELMPFMDAWTNVFASPGTRTSGHAGENFLLVGPQWQGDVPRGMSLLKSPTNMVWLIGRTQTNGTQDFATVHRLQDRLKLKKFNADNNASSSENPRAWQPSTLPSVPPVLQLRNMPTTQFFERLMQLMVANPPHADDAPMLHRLATLQLVPGQPANLNWLNSACFAMGRWLADYKVHKVLGVKSTDGTWSSPPLNLGAYGTDYNTRAAVAMVGLGANLPQDALYPNTSIDQQGKPLMGDQRYRLHFKANQLPPVKAFWSITAYGADEFLIENSLKRYALGDRDALSFNTDGSLDIWIQASEPESNAQRSNWLPVKANAPFLLNARLYWPKDEALQGGWKMPVVERMP
jgi:hypothetical protein